MKIKVLKNAIKVNNIKIKGIFAKMSDGKTIFSSDDEMMKVFFNKYSIEV